MLCYRRTKAYSTPNLPNTSQELYDAARGTLIDMLFHFGDRASCRLDVPNLWVHFGLAKWVDSPSYHCSQWQKTWISASCRDYSKLRGISFPLHLKVEFTHDNLPGILSKPLDGVPCRRHWTMHIISACHLCWALPKLGNFEGAIWKLSFFVASLIIVGKVSELDLDLSHALDQTLPFSHF